MSIQKYNLPIDLFIYIIRKCVVKMTIKLWLKSISIPIYCGINFNKYKTKKIAKKVLTKVFCCDIICKPSDEWTAP